MGNNGSSNPVPSRSPDPGDDPVRAASYGEGDRASGPTAEDVRATGLELENARGRNVIIRKEKPREKGCSCSMPITYDELCGDGDVDGEKETVEVNLVDEKAIQEIARHVMEQEERLRRRNQTAAQEPGPKAQDFAAAGQESASTDVAICSTRACSTYSTGSQSSIRFHATKYIAQLTNRLLEDYAMAEKQLAQNMSLEHAAAQHALSQQLTSEHTQRIEVEKLLADTPIEEISTSDGDVKEKLEIERATSVEELAKKFTADHAKAKLALEEVYAKKIVLAETALQEYIATSAAEFSAARNTFVENLSAVDSEPQNERAAGGATVDKLLLADIAAREQLEAAEAAAFEHFEKTIMGIFPTALLSSIRSDCETPEHEVPSHIVQECTRRDHLENVEADLAGGHMSVSEEWLPGAVVSKSGIKPDIDLQLAQTLPKIRNIDPAQRSPGSTRADTALKSARSSDEDIALRSARSNMVSSLNSARSDTTQNLILDFAAEEGRRDESEENQLAQLRGKVPLGSARAALHDVRCDQDEESSCGPDNHIQSRHWRRLRCDFAANVALRALLENVRSRQDEQLYEQEWSRNSNPNLQSANWRKVRASVNATAAVSSVLREVRAKEDEHLYNQDWNIGYPGRDVHPIEGAYAGEETAGGSMLREARSRGDNTRSKHWRKVRRKFDAVAALGALVEEVRSREDEQLYEQDWIRGSNPNLQSTSHPEAGAIVAERAGLGTRVEARGVEDEHLYENRRSDPNNDILQEQAVHGSRLRPNAMANTVVDPAPNEAGSHEDENGLVPQRVHALCKRYSPHLAIIEKGLSVVFEGDENGVMLADAPGLPRDQNGGTPKGNSNGENSARSPNCRNDGQLDSDFGLSPEQIQTLVQRYTQTPSVMTKRVSNMSKEIEHETPDSEVRLSREQFEATTQNFACSSKISRKSMTLESGVGENEAQLDSGFGLSPRQLQILLERYSQTPKMMTNSLSAKSEGYETEELPDIDTGLSREQLEEAAKRYAGHSKVLRKSLTLESGFGEHDGQLDSDFGLSPRQIQILLERYSQTPKIMATSLSSKSEGHRNVERVDTEFGLSREQREEVPMRDVRHSKVLRKSLTLESGFSDDAGQLDSDFGLSPRQIQILLERYSQTPQVMTKRLSAKSEGHQQGEHPDTNFGLSREQLDEATRRYAGHSKILRKSLTLDSGIGDDDGQLDSDFGLSPQHLQFLLERYSQTPTIMATSLSSTPDRHRTVELPDTDFGLSRGQLEEATRRYAGHSEVLRKSLTLESGFGEDDGQLDSDFGLSPRQIQMLLERYSQTPHVMTKSLSSKSDGHKNVELPDTEFGLSREQLEEATRRYAGHSKILRKSLTLESGVGENDGQLDSDFGLSPRQVQALLQRYSQRPPVMMRTLSRPDGASADDDTDEALDTAFGLSREQVEATTKRYSGHTKVFRKSLTLESGSGQQEDGPTNSPYGLSSHQIKSASEKRILIASLDTPNSKTSGNVSSPSPSEQSDVRLDSDFGVSSPQIRAASWNHAQHSAMMDTSARLASQGHERDAKVVSQRDETGEAIVEGSSRVRRTFNL